jgi:hypothetical protein
VNTGTTIRSKIRNGEEGGEEVDFEWRLRLQSIRAIKDQADARNPTIDSNNTDETRD